MPALLTLVLVAVWASTAAATAHAQPRAAHLGSSFKPQGDGASRSGSPAAGRPVFNDEFDGSKLDTAKWATCYAYAAAGETCTNAGNSGDFSEAQCYTPDNAKVADGVLSLTARAQASKCQGDTKDYASGMVQARGSAADRVYGYFEARIKVPADASSSVGFWPAFWLVPHRNGLWPPEIDVFEFFGGSSIGSTGAMLRGTDGHLHPQRFSSTVHATAARRQTIDYYGQGGPSSTAWDKGFHVWGLDWRADHLDVYVDHKLVWHYTGRGIPSVPMYPIINLALRGKYASALPAELPRAMDIDYVRVWP